MPRGVAGQQSFLPQNGTISLCELALPGGYAASRALLFEPLYTFVQHLREAIVQCPDGKIITRHSHGLELEVNKRNGELIGEVRFATTPHERKIFKRGMMSELEEAALFSFVWREIGALQSGDGKLPLVSSVILRQ